MKSLEVCCLLFAIFYGNTVVHGRSLPDAPKRELNLRLLEYVVSDENIPRLEAEFEGIHNGKLRPWTVGERPENLPKNRYPELLAFDETRVHLKPRSYDESDYINANYIDGFHGEKEYVATQGPLANTSRDFWAMVWQLDAVKMLMLANLFEHGKPKVAKYWPDDFGVYGDIIVTRLFEHSIPLYNHVVRTFSLRKEGSLPRIFRQFHFTGWPDLGVPEDRMALVGLLDQVRKYRPHSKAPIIVHCSAGVGRTGTVIMLDSQLERAKSEGNVDFLNRLHNMRVQRIEVVEKKEQYAFAHKAVNDYFNATGTAREYLRDVESRHREGDNFLIRTKFELPSTLHESLQQLKWYNYRMSLLVEAAEKQIFGEATTNNADDNDE